MQRRKTPGSVLLRQQLQALRIERSLRGQTRTQQRIESRPQRVDGEPRELKLQLPKHREGYRTPLHLAGDLPGQTRRVLRRLKQGKRLNVVPLRHADSRPLAIRIVVQRLPPVPRPHSQRRLPRTRRQLQEDRHHQVLLVVDAAVRLEHALAVIPRIVRAPVAPRQRRSTRRRDDDRHALSPVWRRPLQDDAISRNDRVALAVVVVEHVDLRVPAAPPKHSRRFIAAPRVHPVLGPNLPPRLPNPIARPLQTIRPHRPIRPQRIPRRHVDHRLARPRVHHQPAPGHHPPHRVVERRHVAHRRLHPPEQLSIQHRHHPARPPLLQIIRLPLPPRPPSLRNPIVKLRPRYPLNHLVRKHLRRVRRIAPIPLHMHAVRVHLAKRLQPIQAVIRLHAVPQRPRLLVLHPHRADDFLRIVPVDSHIMPPCKSAAPPFDCLSSSIEHTCQHVKTAHAASRSRTAPLRQQTPNNEMLTELHVIDT